MRCRDFVRIGDVAEIGRRQGFGARGAFAAAAPIGLLFGALLGPAFDPIGKAERVLRDSSKDRFQSLAAVFEPAATYPSPFFTPSRSWRLMLEANVPILDSGLRAGEKSERQAALDVSRANLTAALTRASSETRAGREAVASAQRSLASATEAADEAQQVVNKLRVRVLANSASAWTCPTVAAGGFSSSTCNPAARQSRAMASRGPGGVQIATASSWIADSIAYTSAGLGLR